MGDAHKHHSFEKLEKIYETHVEEIRGEASSLVSRLRDLNKGVSEVNKSIEKVRKAKQDRVKELEYFVEGIQA